MRETILFAPGANPTELLRMLAMHGRNTFNFRIMNAVELAEYALIKSGITLNKTFLSASEEPAVMAEIIKNIPYFEASSYSDAQNIADSLDLLRRLIPDNEARTIEEKLKCGKFTQKNSALISAYKQYISKLEKENKTDAVQLIRYAAAKSEKLDSDFIILKEFPLLTVEEKLLDKVRIGGCEETTLTALLGKAEKSIHIESYVNAYGASNEVEAIIDKISESGIPLDRCTVAAADNSEYSQLFYDLCTGAGIPVTFGCGIPISNSNPASLLELLNKWNTSGFNGIDALGAVIESAAFDRKKLSGIFGGEKYRLSEIINTAGSLRLSFDKDENSRKIAAYKSTLSADSVNLKYLLLAEKLFKEIEKGFVYLIERYSVIRDGMAGRIDRSAVKVIREAIEAYTEFSDDGNISKIIPDILGRTVCSETSREGCLYVTGIANAVCSLRESLFVAGLSASNFPGSPRENYLVLDSDYALFGNEKRIPASENVIMQKKESLDNLLKTAAAVGNKIYLSFSGYNSAELKEQNPSSVLFELFKSEKGEKSTVKEFAACFENAGYFSRKIGSDRLVGKAYIEGKELCAAAAEVEEKSVECDSSRPFSPTDICMFFDCPKKFYYSKILGIEAKETDDPFTVIDARIIGELVHTMMENLAEKKMSKAEFIREGAELFDGYLLSRPALISAEKDRKDFIAMLEKAYDTDPGNEVVLAEESLMIKHPSGITLKGRPDRVEKKKDGSYIIADFKTGRRIKHENDNVRSCLQAILYGYMVKEQYGYNITGVEFRYLRHGKTVSCFYNEHAEANIFDDLSEMKNAVDSSLFMYDNTYCSYCDYAEICPEYKEKK